ncbi:MAG: T9SS type A sorting domain-containing protein [Bacteroidia bacterium]|nr:T9SS type A sorting domain-containing protein [Bacteroidia bacterium]
MNPTLISGTNGAVNAIYRFSNVTDGVDARVTLSAISQSATMSDIDIPASTTGYDPAFQPYVNCPSGTSGSPKTSYIEWQIRFKVAGTNTDTSLTQISATAIDVDGSSTLQERVQAYTPVSYSVNSPNSLTVTQDASSVTAVGPGTNYNGIDSAVKSVMFQMNFANVNLITYRTGGVNRSSAGARQFSIYFKAFFQEATPLPVELIHFKARATKKETVLLDWATASETNNAYFLIERSEDGKDFEEIAAIAGAGNSTRTRHYEYTDEAPMEGVNYYRLVQTDHDGQTKIYDPVTVTLAEEAKALSIDNVFPNPFRANAMITLSAPLDEGVEISFLNSQGVSEKSILTESSKGSTTYTLTGLENLESGVYYIQATQNGVISKTIRMIKN